MATKAWYWLGLGILALSLSSSHTAQSIRAQLSAKLDAMCLRSMPLHATIQTTVGRSDPGLPEVGVAVPETEAGQWQAEVERARAEIETEMRHVQLSQAQALVDRQDTIRTHLLIGKARLQNLARVRVQPAGRAILCPRVRVELSMPHAPAAPVIVVDKDPI